MLTSDEAAVHTLIFNKACFVDSKFAQKEYAVLLNGAATPQIRAFYKHSEHRRADLSKPLRVPPKVVFPEARVVHYEESFRLSVAAPAEMEEQIRTWFAVMLEI